MPQAACYLVLKENSEIIMR